MWRLKRKLCFFITLFVSLGMVSVILQICEISDLQFNSKQYRYESWINATKDKYTSRDKVKFLVTKTTTLQKHDNAKDITVRHVFFYLHTVLNGHSQKDQKIGFQDHLSLNAGQK